MKSFTTAIYNNNLLVGFEAELLAVQQRLACITWLEAIFGVAHVQFQIKDDNTAQNSLNPPEGFRGRDKYTVYYPQGRKYHGSIGNDIDLSFDDSYCSRIFFLAKDSINISPKTDPSDWTDTNVEVAQSFSLIFHANIDALEAAGSSEVLKTGLLYALNQCPKIVITSMTEEIENVWKEFTVTQQIKSNTRYPFYCLRIEGILTYMAMPFNTNKQFDPSVYFDISRNNTQPNISAGNANTN